MVEPCGHYRLLSESDIGYDTISDNYIISKIVSDKLAGNIAMPFNKFNWVLASEEEVVAWILEN